MLSLHSLPDACALRLTTRLPALSAGYLLRRRWHEDQLLRVHSCFRHALNLVWHDGRLCTLLSAPAAAQPRAVAVAVPDDWDWRQHCDPGQWLIYRQGTLFAPRHWHIDLTAAPVWEPSRARALLDALPAARLQQVHDLLAAQLQAYAAQQSGHSVLQLLPVATTGLPIAQWHSQTSTLELQRHVNALLGLGRGLTPDGDDYLLGYLAALHHCHRLTAHFRVMANAIKQGLLRTTEISQHYLQLAIQGHFSQSILILIDSIATNPQPEILKDAAQSVMQYGASSGIDVLAGFLHGSRTIALAVAQWDSKRIKQHTSIQA
ncbi:hypothetical protein WG78_17730 [Amantichitinum ursilacus]|uniref:DUF2877 domain-containing protein n=1 Tax=Amantichitinum ursilacus TaxID=857265 RepID=A0A0N0GLU3_9NEIS|nr:hypothetical protein WG78_17730 [Amantichitinum ursilacus]